MSGRLAIIGLGPGDDRTLTPEARTALEAADVLYGYGPYLDRVPPRDGQVRKASGNRVEGARAQEGDVAVAGRELLERELRVSVHPAREIEDLGGSRVDRSEQAHQAFEPRTFLGAIDDAPYRLDVEKAKDLLTKAGYPNGFNIQMDEIGRAHV